MNERLLKLLKSHTGTDVAQGSLKIHPPQAASAQEVWAAVRGFAFDQGWLCLTDTVLALDCVADLDQAGNRIILSGELVKGPQSLHIRQGETGWILTTLTAAAEGESLKYRETFISTEEGQTMRLAYEVYWSLSEGAYAPHAYRFSGFVKGEGQA